MPAQLFVHCRDNALRDAKPAARAQAGRDLARTQARATRRRGRAVGGRAAGARGARARAWKSACRPAISSGDMPAAMTLSASFFSLFMPAKPRMRVRITLSSGRSLAVPFSRIQLCARIASAVARRFGSCAARRARRGRQRGAHASQQRSVCMHVRPGVRRGVRQGWALPGPHPRWTAAHVHRAPSAPSACRRHARASAAGRGPKQRGGRTGCSIARTHSLASALMAGQGSDWKSRRPFRMASKICCSVSPQNGGTPHSRMYRITPHDQMSASLP